MSTIEPARSVAKTACDARRRSPTAVADQAVHQHRVGAVELDEADRHRLVQRLAVDADVADRERLERPARTALGVGRELREAPLAEDPRRQVRVRTRLAARPEQDAAIAERLEERGVAHAGRVVERDRHPAADGPRHHAPPPATGRKYAMSRIDPVRSSSGRHTASTAIPIRDVVRRDLAELVQEAALARAVQPDHGRELRRVERLHVPRHVTDRERLDHARSPRPLPTDRSAGSTARRTSEAAPACARTTRNAWRRSVRRACPPGTRPSPRPDPTRTRCRAHRPRTRPRSGTPHPTADGWWARSQDWRWRRPRGAG